MNRSEAVAIRSAQLSWTPVAAEELKEAIAILSRVRPPREIRANPWGLTPGQCEVMDALTDAGSSELVAERLGVSFKTISSHFTSAKDRMGAKNRVLALLEWDRWVRAHQETV